MNQTRMRLDIYSTAVANINEVFSRIPADRLQRIIGQLDPELRKFLGSPQTPLPLLENPKLLQVESPIPRVMGKGIGLLVILREEMPSLERLISLPQNSIPAMEVLPTADPRVGPFRGIVTFLQTGEMSHAEARARLWGIPHALWPGAESLKELEGKVVVLEVTKDHVVFREATLSEVKSYSQEVSSKLVSERIVLPPVHLEGDKFYISEGSAELTQPEVVSHKIALLNRLGKVARPVIHLSDPRIHLDLATGSALPFRTFSHFLVEQGLWEKFQGLIEELDRSEDENDIEEILEEIRAVILQDMTIYSDSFWSQFMIQYEGPMDMAQGVFVRGDIHRGIFVRAATNAENLPQYPGFGSGMYRTVPHVKGQVELFKAIQEVYASVWEPKAFWERRQTIP